VQLAEWGAHDRHYGLHSWPAPLAGEMVDRFGTHPVLGMDAFATRQFAPDDFVHRAGLERTLDEDLRMLAELRDGTERKSALSLAVLDRGPWDLFVSVFGDSHAGGHHLWHHHDDRHPRHDPNAHLRGGTDAMVELYRGLDDALAAHLDAAGDSTVFVLLSHGMGPHFDATHLLEEMLRRIRTADGGGLRGSPVSAAAKAAWRVIPAPIRRRGGALPAAAVRRRARRDGLSTSWHEMTADERAGADFYNSPNNSVFGGIRLNIAGREARGVIQPEQADEVLQRLGRDLLEVINVDTGDPVVRSVVRTDAAYDRGTDDRLPDLLVDWDHGAPVDTVWSTKVGLLHGPFGQWRTGDHVPDGLLIAIGGGAKEAGASAAPIDMADLAPSICARFGVEMKGVHGRVVDWLTTA
jgi:predicted AlkP superfamily phosphohydrolase/phosphomutase